MENQVQRYIQFLQNIGDASEDEIGVITNDFVADHARKIINGKLECNTRKEIIAQLTEVRKMAGKLDFQLESGIMNTNPNECAVRYKLDSQNAGSFRTIAMVKFNKDNRLIEIDEIYVQLDS